MTYYFSPSRNAFFDDNLRAAYDASGTWPDDAKKVSDAVFQEFSLAAPPAGKYRGVKSNKPVWLDVQAPSPAQQKAALSAAVQRHLDAQARSMGFSDISDAVSYAEEPADAPMQADGRALRAWRSLVWAAFRPVAAAIEAGERTAPSADELIAALPAFDAAEAA